MKGRALFPIGLHASILAAALCLFIPTVSNLCEAWGGALMSLPLRALGVLSPVSAVAAAPSPMLAEASARVDALGARQLRVHAEIPEALRSIPGLQPVLCRVIDRQPATVEWPRILSLDRSWAEVEGCASYVTSGGNLLGFLARPEPGEGPDSPAKVALLNDWRSGQLPRRVAAQVELSPKDKLRFLVEPASEIDQWPLRCTLLDDPYLAARVQRNDLQVFTIAVDDPLGKVPAGLHVGRMRPWGYRRSEGGFTPIDLFVQPAIHTQFVSMVNLWRVGAARPLPPKAPLSGGRVWPVRLMRLPVVTPGVERWYVSFRWGAPMFQTGAALLFGERLIGRVASAGPGHAFVRPFGQPGEVWALTMLPELETAAPVDLWVVCEERRPEGTRLRLLEGELGGLRGELFTGTMSPDCPAGLWIGPVEAVPGRGSELFVRHHVPDQPSNLGIFERLEAER